MNVKLHFATVILLVITTIGLIHCLCIKDCQDSVNTTPQQQQQQRLDDGEKSPGDVEFIGGPNQRVKSLENNENPVPTRSAVESNAKPMLHDREIAGDSISGTLTTENILSVTTDVFLSTLLESRYQDSSRNGMHDVTSVDVTVAAEDIVMMTTATPTDGYVDDGDTQNMELRNLETHHDDDDDGATEATPQTSTDRFLLIQEEKEEKEKEKESVASDGLQTNLEERLSSGSSSDVLTSRNIEGSHATEASASSTELSLSSSNVHPENVELSERNREHHPDEEILSGSTELSLSSGMSEHVSELVSSRTNLEELPPPPPPPPGNAESLSHPSDGVINNEYSNEDSTKLAMSVDELPPVSTAEHSLIETDQGHTEDNTDALQLSPKGFQSLDSNIKSEAGTNSATSMEHLTQDEIVGESGATLETADTGSPDPVPEVPKELDQKMQGVTATTSNDYVERHPTADTGSLDPVPEVPNELDQKMQGVTATTSNDYVERHPTADTGSLDPVPEVHPKELDSLDQKMQGVVTATSSNDYVERHPSNFYSFPIDNNNNMSSRNLETSLLITESGTMDKALFVTEFVNTNPETKEVVDETVSTVDNRDLDAKDAVESSTVNYPGKLLEVSHSDLYLDELQTTRSSLTDFASVADTLSAKEGSVIESRLSVSPVEEQQSEDLINYGKIVMSKLQEHHTVLPESSSSSSDLSSGIVAKDIEGLSDSMDIDDVQVRQQHASSEATLPDIESADVYKQMSMSTETAEEPSFSIQLQPSGYVDDTLITNPSSDLEEPKPEDPSLISIVDPTRTDLARLLDESHFVTSESNASATDKSHLIFPTTHAESNNKHLVADKLLIEHEVEAGDSGKLESSADVAVTSGAISDKHVADQEVEHFSEVNSPEAVTLPEHNLNSQHDAELQLERSQSLVVAGHVSDVPDLSVSNHQLTAEVADVVDISERTVATNDPAVPTEDPLTDFSLVKDKSVDVTETLSMDTVMSSDSSLKEFPLIQVEELEDLTTTDAGHDELQGLPLGKSHWKPDSYDEDNSEVFAKSADVPVPVVASTVIPPQYADLTISVSETNIAELPAPAIPLKLEENEDKGIIPDDIVVASLDDEADATGSLQEEVSSNDQLLSLKEPEASVDEFESLPTRKTLSYKKISDVPDYFKSEKLLVDDDNNNNNKHDYVMGDSAFINPKPSLMSKPNPDEFRAFRYMSTLDLGRTKLWKEQAQPKSEEDILLANSKVETLDRSEFVSDRHRSMDSAFNPKPVLSKPNPDEFRAFRFLSTLDLGRTKLKEQSQPQPEEDTLLANTKDDRQFVSDRHRSIELPLESVRDSRVISDNLSLPGSLDELVASDPHEFTSYVYLLTSLNRQHHKQQKDIGKPLLIHSRTLDAATADVPAVIPKVDDDTKSLALTDARHSHITSEEALDDVRTDVDNVMVGDSSAVTFSSSSYSDKLTDTLERMSFDHVQKESSLMSKDIDMRQLLLPQKEAMSVPMDDYPSYRKVSYGNDGQKTVSDYVMVPHMVIECNDQLAKSLMSNDDRSQRFPTFSKIEWMGRKLCVMPVQPPYQMLFSSQSHSSGTSDDSLAVKSNVRDDHLTTKTNAHLETSLPDFTDNPQDVNSDSLVLRSNTGDLHHLEDDSNVELIVASTDTSPKPQLIPLETKSGDHFPGDNSDVVTSSDTPKPQGNDDESSLMINSKSGDEYLPEVNEHSTSIVEFYQDVTTSTDVYQVPGIQDVSLKEHVTDKAAVTMLTVETGDRGDVLLEKVKSDSSTLSPQLEVSAREKEKVADDVTGKLPVDDKNLLSILSTSPSSLISDRYREHPPEMRYPPVPERNRSPGPLVHLRPFILNSPERLSAPPSSPSARLPNTPDERHRRFPISDTFGKVNNRRGPEVPPRPVSRIRPQIPPTPQPGRRPDPVLPVPFSPPQRRPDRVLPVPFSPQLRRRPQLPRTRPNVPRPFLASRSSNVKPSGFQLHRRFNIVKPTERSSSSTTNRLVRYFPSNNRSEGGGRGGGRRPWTSNGRRLNLPQNSAGVLRMSGSKYLQPFGGGRRN